MIEATEGSQVLQAQLLRIGKAPTALALVTGNMTYTLHFAQASTAQVWTRMLIHAPGQIASCQLLMLLVMPQVLALL